MPAKFKMPKQRIICACFPLFSSNGAVIPVPINQLPMDFYNNEMRHDPNFRLKVSSADKFLTNHGKVVNEREAFIIAVEAGQVEETRTKGQLCVTDLWEF
jgi:hypothetical protein